MNNTRRIIVFSNLCDDFFLDLRLAIVSPPVIQANIEQSRPITLLFSETGFHPTAQSLPESRGKSGHSKMPCTSFSVNLRPHNSCVIYAVEAIFSTSGQGFSGTLRPECAVFLPFAAESALKITLLPCILRWMFVQKIKTRNRK